MNSLLLTDGYKTSHHKMYPKKYQGNPLSEKNLEIIKLF